MKPQETKQTAKKPRGGSWKKGTSGNPGGRAVDPQRKTALESLMLVAPELAEKAIQEALGGNEKIMVALIRKIFPDQLNISAEIWTRHMSDDDLLTEIDRLDTEIQELKCCLKES